MTATVFVRGAGGTIFEMDVPSGGHALERWEQQLARGDLAIVSAAEWVTRPDGTSYLVESSPAKPKRQAKADAPEPTPEPVADEADGSELGEG